mmetsp:Transcript_28722/g.61872  ORF Transcript_28722/g.61872 Transcript_28722/m.61872 type:complete len:1063 (+) Transcript_28722:186-3374(+)
MMPIASCLLVVVALCSLLCVQGAVHLTNSMPTQARSGSSFKLLKTRVHQKMQNKMKRRLEEGEHEGVISTSAEEEVTYLPTLLLAASVGEPISFGLLDGEEVTGEIGTVTTYSSDRFVWSGTVEGGGSFYLSYAEGAIVGNVYYPSRGVQYEYRPLDRAEGSYSLRAVPTNVYDEEPEEVHAQEMLHSAKRTIPGHLRGDAKLAKKAQGVATLDTATDNAILDVMVLFTNEAYDYFNNDVDSVQAFADLGVQMSNDAYANSGIALRMRLVRAAKVSSNTLQESSFEGDLDRLTNTNDGFMDEDADRIRKAVGADAVVLVTADAQYCGLAWLTADTSLAYGLISVYCPDALSHEVGHNIGAHHDRVTTGITNMNKYNFGYCWDTSATTCSRSVMAYAECETTNGQTDCPEVFFFSSPLVTNGGLGRPTGIATSDNARLHNERAATVTNWMPAVETGGIISSAMPAFAVEDSCAEVVISGWRIGSGADITSVTLAGVEATRILSQTEDSVVVWAGRNWGTGTGDIVVTSSAGLSTLAGGFSYAGASDALTADFESGIPLYWQSTGFLRWDVGRYCSELPCLSAPRSGPSVGRGGTGDFARVYSPADVEETAQLDSYFNLNNNCTDTVTSISLWYHMWTDEILCLGSLVVQEQVSGGGWTTVATASAFQSAQNDDYLPLTHTFSNPTQVTGVRILADPTSSVEGCFREASISIDDIVIQRSTQCTNNLCGASAVPTASPTLVPGQTHAPTRAPSTAAPTTTVTAAPTSKHYFPYKSGVLSNTDDAEQNTESVWQRACKGDKLLFSTCSSSFKDTYIRLFLDGNEVAENDDASGEVVCSEITYTYTAADCGMLELRLGCYSDGACKMTATLEELGTVIVRPPFDHDKFEAAALYDLDTFKGDKYNLIGASECRVLQNAEKAFVVAKSGVVKMDRAKDADCTGTCPKITTMNGYARMHVNGRPVKVDATYLTLVFGKFGNPRDVFRWTQPLMEETEVVLMKDSRGMKDGVLQETDFEFAWQLRMNEEMVGSDGKKRFFPQGGNHYLEVQIAQGGDVRSCLRIDNLTV